MKQLIIADDHQVLREALCEMLEKKGQYRVVAQADDGEQLLKIIQSQKADLIIMDVAMPNLNGLQALERLSRAPGVAPVLILSADECGKQVRAAMRAGAKGYVPKNVGIEELEFAISSILEGKTYLSPSVTAALMTSEGNGTQPNISNILSKREQEILAHLADGKPNREIGKLLHISTRTVDTHRSNILKKLKVKTNAELVKLAIAQGIIQV